VTIETDIKTRLDAHGGLSALVSDRNHAITLPQNPAYPATVYTRISNNAIVSLDSTHKDNPRYQFDVIGSSYPNVRAVVVQLIDAMTTASTFKSVFLTDQDVQYDDDLEVYRAIVDFSVW